MKYFKATVEVGDKKKKIRERILYIKGEDITNAMDIVRKVKSAKWDTIKEITWNDYVTGVQNRRY